MKNYQSIPIYRTFRNSITLAVLVLFAACHSTGDKEDLGGGIFSSVDGEIIVMRAGDRDPIISQFPRMKWLELRKSEKNRIRKMHAMLASGSPLDAEREARSYLQGKPGDLDAILVLASSLAQSRQYELADYYAQLLEKSPQTRAHALNIRGLALLLNASTPGEYRAAEAELLAAHKANPRQIAAGLNLGSLFLETGNSSAAVSIFQETSVRCSKCPAALLGYGIASLRSQKYKDAESAFNEILGKNKNDPLAIYHLALTYLQGQKNSKKAETTLKRLLQDDTLGPSDLKQRAQTLLKKISDKKEDGEDTSVSGSFGGDDKTEDILNGNGNNK